MKKDRKGLPGFNGLTPREWTQLSRSVIPSREVSSPREKYHKEHGATYSVALAERFIKMYSAKGDLVFDPFLGTGTTLVAARNLGRKGSGCELYEQFSEIAKERLEQQRLIDNVEQTVFCGDCNDGIKELKNNSVQLTFTSPPYADFIRKSVEDRKKTHKKSTLVLENKSSVKPYGDNPKDYGNMDYDTFLNSTEQTMENIFDITKPGGYNIWVVKDGRDTKNKRPYIDFHTGIAKAGMNAGFLYHDLIIWDQNDQRSLVLLGYPSKMYVNMNHNFIVVLHKPDEG